jgi:hypothetical protein
VAACVSDALEIEFEVPHRVDRTLWYQRYYLQGLERAARLRWARQPLPLRLVSSAERKIDLEARLQPVLGRLRTPRSSAHVGSYVASTGARSVRFSIDAHDARDVRSPEALAADEVYFKANRWPSDPLSDKVVPIVNGNGLLGAREIARLRALRGREKDLDVVFISRVWGGREHNLRPFEEVAKLPVRSELHAIFPPGTPPDEAEAGMRRLSALGVRVGTTDIPPAELWDLLARSKLVLLRAGKHLCIPWRMVDLLAMGSCVVLDAPFGPEWPVPLRVGINYLDCGLERPEDTSPAPPEHYARVSETIAAALDEPATLDAIRAANARYFDDHASPERVAEYVVGRLRKLLEA